MSTAGSCMPKTNLSRYGCRPEAAVQVISGCADNPLSITLALIRPASCFVRAPGEDNTGAGRGREKEETSGEKEDAGPQKEICCDEGKMVNAAKGDECSALLGGTFSEIVWRMPHGVPGDERRHKERACAPDGCRGCPHMPQAGACCSCASGRSRVCTDMAQTSETDAICAAVGEPAVANHFPAYVEK